MDSLFMLHFVVGGQWMDPHWLAPSIWKNRTTPLWSFICPLCKTPRRVPFRSRPGGLQYIQIFLTSFVFMLASWPWLSWKGIVSFVPFWTVFEWTYRWRMRGALKCRKCGFDPYLFLIDDKWAGREVDTHWRNKFSEKGIPYPEKPSKTPGFKPKETPPSS